MRVYVGMSSRGNDLNADLVKWLMLQRMKPAIQSRLFISTCGTSAKRAQAGLFKDMYANPNFDAALFLDTDVVPPINVIEQLYDADKQVVTAPIWSFDDYNKDIHLNIHYTHNGSTLDRVYRCRDTGVEKILSTSFSCLLVRKDIFDVFHKAKEDPILWSPMLGSELKDAENDVIFFSKLAKLNIPAYVCWDAKGGVHHRHVSLSDEVLDKYVQKRYV